MDEALKEWQTKIETQIQTLFDRDGDDRVWQATYGEKIIYIGERITKMEEHQKKQTELLESLASKPSKRVEEFILSIIKGIGSAIAGSLITLFAFKIGGKL